MQTANLSMYASALQTGCFFFTMDAHHQPERRDLLTNRVSFLLLRKKRRENTQSSVPSSSARVEAAPLGWYVVPPAGYAPAARFEPRNMLPPLNSTGTPSVCMLGPTCANLLSKPLKRGSDVDSSNNKQGRDGRASDHPSST